MENLPRSSARAIIDVPSDTDVIYYSLLDIRLANHSIRKSFHETNYEPVCHRGRRMALRHSGIVRKELDMMLRDGIVAPATSVWSFLLLSFLRKTESINSVCTTGS